MAKFKISGVWRDSFNRITHYSVHTVNGEVISRAIKKQKVIQLSC